MNRERAVACAEAERWRFEIPPSYAISAVDKRIVELVEGETTEVRDAPPHPGPRYDVVAWVVTFRGGGPFVRLTLDDATGSVVRVRRGR